MVSKSFLLVAVFRAEMWRRVSRTDSSPQITVVFFCKYKLQKTLPVTTLLLFGHATLLCGTFLFIFVGWRICLVITLWTPSDWYASGPHPWPIHSHWLGSPMLCLWFYLTSRGTSEMQQKFSARRIWNFSTEEDVESCRKIPTVDHCEWGYWVKSELPIYSCLYKFPFYYYLLKIHATDWFIHTNKSQWIEADIERVRHSYPIINLQERRSWSYSGSSVSKDTWPGHSLYSSIYSFYLTSFSFLVRSIFFFLQCYIKVSNLFA